MFEFLNWGNNTYTRRVQTLLREARFAQLEHTAAAEHHDALARMYAERVERLEAASSDTVQTHKMPFAAAVSELENQRTERPPFRILKQTSPDAQGAL